MSGPQRPPDSPGPEPGGPSDSELLALWLHLQALRSRARRSLGWGLTIATIGGIATLIGWQSAQDAAATDPSGGSHAYYVLWGAIAYGLLKAGRAVRVLLAIRGQLRGGRGTPMA
jgi:hypothetical protein